MATKQSSRKSSSRKSTGRSARGGSSASSGSSRSSSRKTSSKSSDGTRGARGGARKSASRGSSRSGGSSSSSSRSSKSASGSRGGRGAMDALKLLKQDHENVDAMFKKYDRMKEGDERKAALREQVCMELTVHAQIEEELFYPALKSLFEQEEMEKAVDLIEEADVEHASLKWLIEQLQSGDQSEEGMIDARVKVLSEYVKHHVQEEEGEIFKAARKVDVDLEELGMQIEARKAELMGGEQPQREQEQKRGGRSGGRSGGGREMTESEETETER